jgi:pimeloyl-ACP methyl ester carboxylesterase
VREFDLTRPDGGTLHGYDTGQGGDDGRLAVFWHHGTPNIGAPPEPLFAAADALALRWLSYDRPSYGGSSPDRDRNVASAAGHMRLVADALGIQQFAAMGHSGGGPHALAGAALMPERVVAVVSMAGLAPYPADGLDWFAGMIPSGVRSLRAARAGRAEKERLELSGAVYDPEFTAGDLAVLDGPWSWLKGVVAAAMQSGPEGAIDDDLAYVAPWGFDPTQITRPALFVHGGRDGIVPCAHSQWLVEHRPAGAELWLSPDDGHLSVLNRAEEALGWLRAQAS